METASVPVTAALFLLLSACTSSKTPMALMQEPDAHFLCRGDATQVRNSISAFLNMEGMAVNEHLGVIEAMTPVETVRLGFIFRSTVRRRTRFQIQLIPDLDGQVKICRVNIFGEFQHSDKYTTTSGFSDTAFALADRLCRSDSVCKIP